MDTDTQKLLQDLKDHIITKPTTSLNHAQEVLNIAKEQNDNNFLIESYYLTGLSYWENGDFKETLKSFETAYQLIQTNSLPKLQIYIKSALAIMFALRYEKEKAYQFIKETIALENLIDDYHCLITMYSRLGGSYIKLSMITEGLSILLKAKDILNEEPQFKEEGYIFSHLSIIQTRIKNHDESIIYSKKAEWVFDKIGNHPMGIIATLINRALISEENVDISKESIESLLKAKELCLSDQKRYEGTLSLVYSNLAFEYFKNFKNNYNDGLINIEKSHKIAEEKNIKNLLCINLSTILKINSILKKGIPDFLISKFKNEKEIILFIFKLLPIVNDLLIEKSVLTNIVEYYNQNNKFQEAFQHQKELTRIQIKINEKEKKENLFALSIKYEAHEKELELKQLKIERKELELRQKEELENINKNLEYKIKERTSELILKNNELEQYAYIVAHDLKEPIRSIVGFSQLIEKRSEKELPDSTRELLQYVIDASYNMREMVDDLLQFSTIQIKKESYSTIDVKQLLEKAILNLRNNITESNAELIIEALPKTIEGDKTRIGQLFQNIISNAIKFKHPDKNPIIRINGFSSKDGYTFTIKDNGIGIKEEFQEKIFKLFKRLHTKEKFKGSGIGLSICEKIVKQHGGDIWVTSEEGKGTTFHFTLR